MPNMIQNFLKEITPLLDVRSPIEYKSGHIPSAISFPLFEDNERAAVGTVYKQEGKESAIKLGLAFVGPKLLSFVEKAEQLCGLSKKIRLYCARGGMRSNSMAWLLRTAGISCQVLEGGYKIYRNWALSQFLNQYHFVVLGGFTGCGKTELLQQLKKQGEQVIDLENIASHRGSAYGHLGYEKQPPNELFENLLAQELSLQNPHRPIWIEDESKLIGSCIIPKELWQQMKEGLFIWLNSTKEERMQRLLKIYGSHNTADLITSTQKLVKKLGAVRTQEIIEAIEQKKIETALERLLEHYDRAYLHCCHKHGKKISHFSFESSTSSLIEELCKSAHSWQTHYTEKDSNCYSGEMRSNIIF